MRDEVKVSREKPFIDNDTDHAYTNEKSLFNGNYTEVISQN